MKSYGAQVTACKWIYFEHSHIFLRYNWLQNYPAVCIITFSFRKQKMCLGPCNSNQAQWAERRESELSKLSCRSDAHKSFSA